jgi:hypothetical protein
LEHLLLSVATEGGLRVMLVMVVVVMLNPTRTSDSVHAVTTRPDVLQPFELFLSIHD